MGPEERGRRGGEVERLLRGPQLPMKSGGESTSPNGGLRGREKQGGTADEASGYPTWSGIVDRLGHSYSGS